MAELMIENCPFGCKSKTAEIDVSEFGNRKFYKVKCECGATGPTANTIYEAIDAWNKRS